MYGYCNSHIQSDFAFPLTPDAFSVHPPMTVMRAVNLINSHKAELTAADERAINGLTMTAVSFQT